MYFDREDGLGDMEIVAVPLAELDGHTAELIGTNVNANAYSKYVDMLVSVHYT